VIPSIGEEMNGTVVSGSDHKLVPYSFIWGRKQIVIATRRFLFGIQEDVQWSKCNTPLSEPMRIHVTIILYCIFILHYGYPLL